MRTARPKGIGCLLLGLEAKLLEACFVHAFWDVLQKKTCFMHPLGPWACHCDPTLRPPGPGRANPLHVFPVFGSSHFFALFACFPSCLASPLVKNGIQKLPFARRCLPVGPRMPTNDTITCSKLSLSIFFSEKAKRRTSQQTNKPTRPSPFEAWRGARGAFQ